MTEKQRKSPEVKEMHGIHFFDGDKGGVGKSIAAMTFTQYCLDNQVPLIAIDSDRYNPDLENHYTNLQVQRATFSEDEKVRSRKREENPDRLIDLAVNCNVVISLPAQVGIQLNKWLDVAVVTSERLGVNLVRWFLTSGTYESLRLFERALKRHGKNMPFVLVKNFGLSDSWEELENNEELQTLIQEYGAKVIDFPRLELEEINAIQKNNWTFDEARQSLDLYSVQQTRIHTFLGKAYMAFESTGLTPHVF